MRINGNAFTTRKKAMSHYSTLIKLLLCKFLHKIIHINN